jgi:hypothetical protein
VQSLQQQFRQRYQKQTWAHCQWIVGRIGGIKYLLLQTSNGFPASGITAIFGPVGVVDEQLEIKMLSTEQ